MATDFEVVMSELSIQRQYLDTGIGTVGTRLDTVHSADTSSRSARQV